MARAFPQLTHHSPTHGSPQTPNEPTANSPPAHARLTTNPQGPHLIELQAAPMLDLGALYVSFYMVLVFFKLFHDP